MAVKSTWMDTARNNAKAQDERDKQASIIRQQNIKNQQSAQIASRLDTAPMAKNTKSAQIASRLDNKISSPILNYAIGSWQGAFAADRLNNGSYAATGGIKQEEAAQKAKDLRVNTRSAQLAANLDNSLMGQATRDNQKASFERAMESLYNQMEIAKNANNTRDYTRAQDRYSNISKMLQDLENPTSTAAYAADWENRMRTEIMSTDDRVLMPKLERLLELADARMREASDRGDERRNGLTETEKQYNAIYNSLKNQYGDQVDGWIEYAKRMDNKAKMKERLEQTRQEAKDKKFGSSAKSVPLNMLSGAGYMDIVAQKMQRGITGSGAPIDYNSDAQSASKMVNTIRSTVSEDMGATGQFLYNVGMSIADLIPSIVAGKISPSSAAAIGKATLTLLSGSAATNAMQQAVERGASDDQALTIGLLSGAAEAVMEKIPLDRLLNPTNTKAVKEIILNTLKQAGVEGMEEGLTTIANTLADALVMGNRSELQTNIRSITAAKLEENPNMSREAAEEAATKEAMLEWLINLGMDTAAGVASGVAFGSITSFADYINYKNSEAATPKLQPETQKQPPVADITPTPQQAQEAPAPASVMPKLQQTETVPVAEFRQTAAEILSEGIFDSPTYGEALVQTGLKRSDVRDALRAVARNNITAASDPKVQIVLNAIRDVDAKSVHEQVEMPTKITPEQTVSEVVSRVVGESKGTTENANFANKVPDIQPKIRKSEQGSQPAMGDIGDMGAKTSEFRHDVKESQSKTTPYYYEKNNVPEEGRADNRYTVVHRDESLHNARSRLEQDYEGEAADLRRKTTWSDEEMLEGDLILRKLREEAEQTGDWSKHREWAKVFKEHKTEAGRSLSVLAMLNNETGDAILSRAAATLETATKGTDTDAVMQTTSEFATKFDAAVAEKNVDELINIIKETARTRKTGFYSGKLGKLTSLPLEKALERIANYAKAEPAAGTVTAHKPKAFQVGDVVIPSDRGNFGHVVKVNADGTYDVHFKAKSGHEATKTFAAEELKSPHTGGVTAADISADPGSAFEFLKSFAAAGIENIANDTNRASVVEMAKTIRRNAMLSKLSTIMRNLVGNGAFDIADTVARDISVPLDMLLSKITGTRSVAADYGYLSKAKRQGMLDGLAMAMLETSLDVNARDQQSKYENSSQRTFKMSGGVVSKLLSTWEGVMGYGLYVTDEMSKGATSAEVQRGLNKLYENGKIKVGDDSLRDGGAQEALYRTFQDDTALARVSTGMRDALNNVPGLGDAMIPFAQVPANLADRAIEYSPVGLTKSIYKLTDVLVKAKKGTLTAAEQAKAVQTLGRNITGSSLIAAAATLAARGLIHVVNPGGEDENKDKAASEKAQGLNGTQWNLSATLRDMKGESTNWQDGDILMSIAFLEPFNAHLTIGAMLAEDLEAEGQLTAKTILRDTFTGSLTAIGDLPMFDAFGEAVNAFRYSDKEREGEKWLDAGAAMVANVVGSIIPNAAKGIAQGLDPYQRDLYSKDTLGGQIADQFRAVFDRKGLPIKQDAYGNEMKNPDQPLNFLNSNVLPGAITKYTETDLQKALNDISKQTGSNAVYLSKDAPKSISVDGEKFELTEAQQKQFMAERGDTYKAASSALENDETYQGFSKEWKLKAYEYAEDYATQTAKDGLGTKFEPSDWISDLEGKTPEDASEALVQKVVEYMAGKAGENKYLGLETLLENKSIDDQMALSCMSTSCYDAYTANCEKADISVQQFLDAYGTAQASGESNAEKKQAALDYIAGLDISAKQKGALAQAVHEAIGSFIPQDTQLPDQWLIDIGDTNKIVSQMSTDRRQKYNTYVKDSGIKMQMYLDAKEYKDNYDPVSNHGIEAPAAFYEYVTSLGIGSDKAKALYLGFYAESTWEKQVKKHKK